VVLHQDHQQFDVFFAQGQEWYNVVGHNVIEEEINHNQISGTAMVAIGHLCLQVQETGADPSGLGRYSCVTVGGGGKTTVICTVHVPGDPGNDFKNCGVWDQQARTFESRGNVRPPKDILSEDLIYQLVKRKESNHDIVLVGDLNKDVNDNALV
jgi:hypothetical protein